MSGGKIPGKNRRKVRILLGKLKFPLRYGHIGQSDHFRCTLTANKWCRRPRHV